MKEKLKIIFRSDATMIGAVIGVGVFGLPYAFAQVGYFLGLLYLVVIGFFVITVHLLYAEVTIQTPGKHRLVGYVERYLGKRWRYLATVVSAGSIWGAIVAYIIIGGSFAHMLLSGIFGGNLFYYQLGFFVVGILLVHQGLRFIVRLEAILAVILAFLFVAIILRGIPEVSLTSFTDIDYSNFFLPYGVILFSLIGLGAIPEVRDSMGRMYHRLRLVIIFSGIATIALYAAFAFVVVGISGSATSTDALSDLITHFGPIFGVVGISLGLISVMTSFLILCLELIDTFRFDYKWNKNLSWIVTCAVPLLIFLIGARSFIHVVDFTGSVFAGIIAVITILLFEKIRKKMCDEGKQCFLIPKFFSYFLMVIFLIGAVLGVYYSLV